MQDYLLSMSISVVYEYDTPSSVLHDLWNYFPVVAQYIM